MTENLPSDFAATLTGSAPPHAWPAPLAALWWLARDATESADATWARAHALVQDASGSDAPGCTPICTGSRAIPAMRATGTDRADRPVFHGSLARSGQLSHRRPVARRLSADCR